METRTIAVDFGKTDIYSKIETGLAGLEVGVLGKRTPCSLILLICMSTHFKDRTEPLGSKGVVTYRTGHSLTFSTV